MSDHLLPRSHRHKAIGASSKDRITVAIWLVELEDLPINWPLRHLSLSGGQEIGDRDVCVEILLILALIEKLERVVLLIVLSRRSLMSLERGMEGVCQGLVLLEILIVERKGV